jgi:peroxiredoxin
MARTFSTMLSLGTLAPDFVLPDTDGKRIGRDDLRGTKGLLVVFMCNHCPYVKHIAPKLSEFAREYQGRISVVGINSNDTKAHPDDAPQKMAIERIERGYVFPYLFDEDQSVAKAYHAACTPDFYLFDGAMRLVYRGQFDDSRPGSGVPVTGDDLREAVEVLLSGSPLSPDQKPSMGCNIKWKPGNEPNYSS